MIATATINGIAIEINGTPEECYRFFAAHKKDDFDYKISPCPERFKTPPWWVTGNVEKIRHCNPFARHYGNCGAEDCPIIGMRIKK